MPRSTVFQHPVPGSGVLPGPIPGDEIVVSVERPGYGLAPRLDPGTVPTIAGIAERTLDQVRTRGVDHIDHVVGWSGGGHYALAMAALAPERIDAVTLIATPAHHDDVPWIPDHLRPLTARLRRAPGTAVDQLVDHIGDLRADLSMLCAGDDTTLLDREPEWRQRLERMLGTAFELGTTGHGHRHRRPTRHRLVLRPRRRPATRTTRLRRPGPARAAHAWPPLAGRAR